MVRNGWRLFPLSYKHEILEDIEMRINSINAYQQNFSGKKINPKKIARVVDTKLPKGLSKSVVRLEDGNEFGRGLSIGTGIFTGTTLYTTGRGFVTLYC